MTSRERVRSALSHCATDCLPVDFGSTSVTGVHVSRIAVLPDYFGVEKKLIRAYEPYQMLGTLDEDLKQAIYPAGLLREYTASGGSIGPAF